ncbi:hypothetical protein Hdeb2414_s0010g00328631 [Helianthus debilis subsp. tardiflorus]
MHLSKRTKPARQKNPPIHQRLPPFHALYNPHHHSSSAIAIFIFSFLLSS